MRQNQTHPPARNIITKILYSFMAVTLAVLMSLSMSFEAEAKRLGGGRSIGKQSTNVTQRNATPTRQNTNQAAPNQAAGQNKRPWGAMLGGLAAGLGLAWLANSLGLGEGFANIMMMMLLAGAAFMLFRLFKNKTAGQNQTNTGGMAYQGANQADPARSYKPSSIGNDASARPWENQNTNFTNQNQNGSIIGSAIGARTGASTNGLGGSQNWGIPQDFDTQGFTQAAERNFRTLQKAWDTSDIASLRAMMTDEMLLEVKRELDQREPNSEPTQTEVLMLNSQLLGIEEQEDLYMASVEFSGMIKEGQSAGPAPFREVWNMTKDKKGGGWLVAGIQALD